MTLGDKIVALTKTLLPAGEQAFEFADDKEQLARLKLMVLYDPQPVVRMRAQSVLMDINAQLNLN